jgi:hypothetical protein
MSDEDEDRKVQHDNEERNSDDEAMSIDEEEVIRCFSQGKNRSKFRIEIDRRTPCTRDDENKGLDVPTPSMTDTPTTSKSSPVSELTPSNPCLLISTKTGTKAYTCPQCTYSCGRMCDLR